jgi:hypothetical protein
LANGGSRGAGLLPLLSSGRESKSRGKVGMREKGNRPLDGATPENPYWPEGQNDFESRVAMAIVTRSTDKKARLTLPKEFADSLVIIERISDSELRIKKARAIPEDEVWLWKNPVAGGMVLLGIEEAKAGRFVPGPDLDADAARFEAAAVEDPEDE